MIVSCLAPASLAEERVRGSLDVLMTTPLSTRVDPLGQVAGDLSCRPLAGGPAGTDDGDPGLHGSSVHRACRRRLGRLLEPLGLVDRIAAPCLIVGQMLSYGAAITSVGLALATWVPRLGRAIAINVAIFVLITIGWPALL